MPVSKKVRPVNSLVFVSDVAGGTVPEWADGELILSNSSCIQIRCYPEQDGPTTIVLGQSREIRPDHPPKFEGDLDTPNRSVAVWTVEREIIVESRVPKTRTRVCIWVDHPRWPEKVIIGLV
jgi:hypothetical protein